MRSLFGYSGKQCDIGICGTIAQVSETSALPIGVI